MEKSDVKNTSTKPTQSAADPIYISLKKLIVSGAIAGDVPLRQDEIAKQHGVSKIPVREALRKLEIEGLVTFRPNRGVIVRKLTAPEILQLMDIRVALECRAIELAVPNQIEADFSAARQLLSECSAETEPARWSEMNIQFHHLLYEPCGNAHLLWLITDIEQRIGPYSRVRVTEVSGLARPMAEHVEILNACEKGDVSEAVNLLRRHIETTKKEAAAFMRRKPDY